MALLIGPGTRIIDANGNLINGGKVRVYNRNTTTLSSIYSDAAMGSALTNPCVANASGYPSSDGSAACQIFAASGQYDVAFLDASNNVLASFEDVPTYGEENGDLSRTVTGNGRITITGAAGAVLIQAGDPSPDNTGGTLTIEGQAGTQLDSLTLDAANTNTTGRLKENSRAIGGVVTTGTATSFSAAANVDIALPEITDGVRAWKVTLFDLTASAGTSIWIRFSYDGGATYKTGAADYAYANLYNTTTTPTSATSTGAIQINIPSVLNGSKVGFFEMTVVTVESGSNPTIVNGRLISYDAVGSAPSVMDVAGYGLGSYGRATHMRITNAGGQTYTGKYRVEALYGFGEA